MAEPFLICPPEWHRTNLEARPDSQFIVRVESGGTPSTTVDEFWDGDIPWLTPKEITGLAQGLFVSHTERFITSQGTLAATASGTKLRKCMVNAGRGPMVRGNSAS